MPLKITLSWNFKWSTFKLNTTTTNHDDDNEFIYFQIHQN